jgi:hypothetical protein
METCNFVIYNKINRQNNCKKSDDANYINGTVLSLDGELVV